MAYFYEWRPYVSVDMRRRQAAREVAALKKQGRAIDPVVIEGRTIARTFWGKAWCKNLESYSDYANRLPRGRTYVRNGSVIDLQISPGQARALVSGTTIYEVDIAIKRAAKARWRTLSRQCAGKIDSVVELLQGELSKGVMEVLARRDTGLFPSPGEISLRCSCPDWAGMCKHVAAVLYGVGARLDHAPEMLFVLRDVDHMDLVAEAGSAGTLGELTDAAQGQVLDAGGLADIFGIDLEDDKPPSRSRAKAKPGLSARKTRARKKTASVKPTVTGRTPRGSVTAKRAGAARTKAPSRTASRTSASKRGSRKRSRTITARELIERGVPRSTFQNWVTVGVLSRTDQRGVYATTAATEERIGKALRKRRRER